MAVRRILLVEAALLLFGLILTGGASAMGSMLSHTGQIAFTAYIHGNADVYLIDVERAFSFNLTRSQSWDARPSWSPQGHKLMFLSNRENTTHVYILDMTTGTLTRVSNGQGDFLSPQWSSDGARILFLRTVSGRRLWLYSIDADGTDERLESDNLNFADLMELSGNSRYDTLSLSPDLQQVMFVAYRDDEFGLYVGLNEARFRQNARKIVNLGLGFSSSPRWSTDSSRIAYTTRLNGRIVLYVINANGSEQRHLPTGDIWIDDITWRPG